MENQRLWEPIIQISYHVKVFNEVTIMKNIEKLRTEFGAE